MAIDPLTGALIGGGISAVGSILGGSTAAKEQKKARQALERAMAEFNKIELPSMENMQFTPEQLQYIGDYNPELEEAIRLQSSQMEGVSTDPRLQAAQMAALSQLQEIGEQGGMTDSDMAALNLVRRQAAAQDEAKQQQILQNMQQRGIGGSGAELIARLKSSQSAADRMSEQDLNVLQGAQQRALQAMMQSGQLGGQMRSQEFGEKSDIARAQDIVNQFNTQQDIGRQTRNVGSSNQAALRNLSTQQDIAARNTGISNEAALRNKNLAQQEFENQYKIAAGKAGQASGMANQYNQQAATQAALYGGVGQAIGGGLMGYGLSQMNAKPTAPTQYQTTVDPDSKYGSIS